MKIAFNLINCGLGNNGGSLTIIKSANTLVDMGHEVYIIDSMPNQCTWEKLRAERCDYSNGFNWQKMPEIDVFIATGFKSVLNTEGLPIKSQKRFHWVRGIEKWNYTGQKEQVEFLLSRKLIKLVNGIQLQRKLASFGIASHVIRPGYDFEDLFPLKDDNRRTDYISLGGIYNRGDKRKTKRVEWIFNTVIALRNRGHKVKLHMIGTDELLPPHKVTIDSYTKNPLTVTKNAFYNGIDAWLAPTELEGLHMPPAEAMLTECPVVGTNAELSGMEDYLVNYETGLISDNTLKSFINCTESLVKDAEWRKQLGKEARKTVLSLGDRKTNMTKMVELFEQHIP